MRRLNVRFTQIEECIRTSLFAVDVLPRHPPLSSGEEMLLQLVLQDARQLGKEHARVEFALIFQEARPDPTGEISRQHWPNAGKTWAWILYCSETLPTVPFSLEDLPLSRDYGGQMNPQYIEAGDEALIRSRIGGGIALSSQAEIRGAAGLLTAIRNFDRVYRLAPHRQTVVTEHRRRIADSWLGDALKAYYEHRCQICLHDFVPRYGVPCADTRLLTPPERGGEPVSSNTVVVCPNHNAIIAAARPEFDRSILGFRFPNGLREDLKLRDHLLS